MQAHTLSQKKSSIVATSLSTSPIIGRSVDRKTLCQNVVENPETEVHYGWFQSVCKGNLHIVEKISTEQKLNRDTLVYHRLVWRGGR